MNANLYYQKLSKTLDELDYKAVDAAVSLIDHAWRSGRQIITLGNGGSALTALHLINDWNKSIYLSTGRQFKGRTLVDNVGIVTAYANDLSYERIFEEQLKNILGKGDLVISISGSGNSPNVLRATELANSRGAVTLGLCGYDGGKLRHIAQNVLWVNVCDMQIVEDVHMSFGHVVMRALCSGEI
jgi:D-sedoheptulose 7-phosphate isomerase